jgi:hypothetical protein
MGTAESSPSPQHSPGERGYVDPGERGYVDAERRLPNGPITCPTGDLVVLPRGDPRVGEAATSFLEAALTHEGPDPHAMWELMDPSFRALFFSYEDFRAQVEEAPYNPDYAVWELEFKREQVYSEGDPDLPGLLSPWLLQNCEPQVIEALRSGVWHEAAVFWPRLFDVGLSAGVTQLYFLGRPDGPKLWVIYH